MPRKQRTVYDDIPRGLEISELVQIEEDLVSA